MYRQYIEAIKEREELRRGGNQEREELRRGVNQ